MVNRRVGGALAGAGTGALQGFIAGGPLGGAVGGALGGLSGYFGTSGGSKARLGGSGGSGGGLQEGEKRFDRFTPQQQQITEMLMNMLSGEGDQPQGGLFGDLFGDEAFDAASDPAMRKYQQEIVPGLAERFSGSFGVPGASSSQRSSGFQQALARSGENLASQLGASRLEQQRSLVQQFLQSAMEPQFHTRYEQAAPSQFGQGLKDLMALLPEGISAFKDYRAQKAQAEG